MLVFVIVLYLNAYIAPHWRVRRICFSGQEFKNTIHVETVSPLSWLLIPCQTSLELVYDFPTKQSVLNGVRVDDSVRVMCLGTSTYLSTNCFYSELALYKCTSVCWSSTKQST
jgi:hypothetical protein